MFKSGNLSWFIKFIPCNYAIYKPHECTKMHDNHFTKSFRESIWIEYNVNARYYINNNGQLDIFYNPPFIYRI